MLKFKKVPKNITATPADALDRAVALAETIAEGMVEREKYKNLHLQEVTGLKDERSCNKENHKRNMASLEVRETMLKALLDLKAAGASAETIAAYKESLSM